MKNSALFPLNLRPHSGDALLLIDVQNDFLPGGSLAVPSGDEIIPILNRYIEAFSKASLPVYASRDWHPPDHRSFRAQGGIWPPHCIAGSRGAEFSPKLDLPANAVIISKATNLNADAYSDFDEPDLEQSLHQNGISRLFIGGLATDYCVLYTVRDALSHGFEVHLLLDGIRAINVKPGDGQRAIEEMTSLGAHPIHFEDIAA
ncbi:nicotinamidase [Sulfuricella sp.]|uniref:nicotinamidase n=1 Tax=Sulfuricella sp. TaxID=2099377 RepID=UPI002D1B6AD8|nr:nicotinamidase [Sulfuricella sp.]HUX64205.1 nicotinamidase [Sulfuricella sp.]